MRRRTRSRRRPAANGSTWWRTSRTSASAAAGVRPARSSSTARSADSSSRGGASSGSGAIRSRPRLVRVALMPDRLHRLHRLRAAAVGGAGGDAGRGAARRDEPLLLVLLDLLRLDLGRQRLRERLAQQRLAALGVVRVDLCALRRDGGRGGRGGGGCRRRGRGQLARVALRRQHLDARLGEEAADAAGADRALLEDDGTGSELVPDLRNDLLRGSGRRTSSSSCEAPFDGERRRCRLRRRACSAGSRCTREQVCGTWRGRSARAGGGAPSGCRRARRGGRGPRPPRPRPGWRGRSPRPGPDRDPGTRRRRSG